MKLKQNPDSYLLYESGKFITFNIRLKVIMKQKIDVDALKKAAQTAFSQASALPQMLFHARHTQENVY